MEILHNLSNYITNDVLYLVLFISVLIITWNIISYLFVLYGKCNCVECTDEEVNSCFDYNQTEELPPFKYYYDLFSDDERNEIIEYARPKMERSVVDKGGEETIDKERTSSTAWIHHSELQSLTRVSKFISEITSTPIENQELWQVVHYLPGQEYKPHYDDLNPHGDYDTKKLAIKRNKEIGCGRRVYTFFIYLNDVKKGGETWFPRVNRSIKPIPSMGVLWNNLSNDQRHVHMLSEHGGQPVIEGEKWAINVWIRQGPWK